MKLPAGSVRTATAALLLVAASGLLQSSPASAAVGDAALPPAAAPAPDAPPSGQPLPGPPRPLAIAAPSELRLANGLRVVLAERRGVQLVTATLLVLSGAEADPRDRAGLASLTAELLTKGTRQRSATRIAQDAESLGGLLDSSAGWHEAAVGITVTVPKLDAALALVGEVVREPTFAPVELERLRGQTLDDLKVAYSRPDRLAAVAAQRLLFGAGPYGHPASGTPASLPTLTRADVLRLHAARYRPDNAVLVLAGDVDAATARQLAERHFGAWRSAGPAASTSANGANGLLSAPIVDAESPQTTLVVDLPQSGQAAVVVGTPLPPVGADRATASVLNAVLGGGFSARLNQEIRIRRGLSYGAGSGLDARPLAASLRATVQTRNEAAPEVVALVQAELDRLATTPVGAAELAARKAALIGDFGRSIETTAGLAAAVQTLIVTGQPTAALRTRVDELAAVDAAALQRYAAARLPAERRRVVVAGDAARFVDALRAAVPTLTVVPAERIRTGRFDGR